MTKSKSPKSDAKRPTKSSKKSAEKRPTAPKKAPTKKPATSVKPRGRTAVFEAPPEPSAPPESPAPAPAIATPPVPKVESEEAFIARLIPGEAIGGDRLSRAIRYAAAVTPHKEGTVVFTRDDSDQPLVSGHDERRCHTAFLPRGAAMLCDVAVPRKDALAFADLLDGLSHALVRIGEGGTAHVTHGVGQYPVRFALGTAPITQRWQPPSQLGHTQTVGSLRMKASGVKASCEWSKATVHQFQSVGGIEWNTLTDEETGELLARAVLAEDGKDLFPQESRQREIPNTRTAGTTNTARMSLFESAVAQAEAEANEIAKACGVKPLFPTAEESPSPTAAEVTFETDAIDLDAPPVAPTAPTLPAPPESTTRLRISAPQWNSIVSDNDRARLTEPESGVRIAWIERDGHFVADVPNDLVSLVHATGDELGVLFADDTDDSIDLGAAAEEPEAL